MDAIKNFEILIEQQEAAPEPGPRYAQGSFLLGNLYQQQGDKAKALETWKRGTQRFPEDKKLSERVDASGK